MTLLTWKMGPTHGIVFFSCRTYLIEQWKNRNLFIFVIRENSKGNHLIFICLKCFPKNYQSLLNSC